MVIHIQRSFCGSICKELTKYIRKYSLMSNNDLSPLLSLKRGAQHEDSGPNTTGLTPVCGPRHIEYISKMYFSYTASTHELFGQ